MGGRQVISLVVLLTLGHVTDVSGCQSRSGEDTERVYSHQGAEPTYEKEDEAASVNTADSEPDQDDEDKIRENGEVKVRMT